MPWVQVGLAVVGSALQSNSASNANASQERATAAATAENARQYDRNVAIEQQRYDQNRTDRQPYIATGRTALAQYLREMGLPGVGSGQALGRASAQSPAGTAMPQQSRDTLRSQLLGQYTTTTPGVAARPYMGGYDDFGDPGKPATSAIDETGLNAAIERLMQQQAQQSPQQYTAANGTSYTDGLPDMESIQTTAPQAIELDPGYEFGKQQGQQALDRQFAKQGGRVSGASMKAAAEYGTNYATTGYSAAYGRRQDRLNRLGVLAGYGSTPASGSTGQQPNNGNAALISSQGNATGAAQLAQGNIWGNAINKIGAQFNNQPVQNEGFGTGSKFGNQDYGQYL